MASKKPKEAATEVAVQEEEKLDIEDIKDPFDELDEPAEGGEPEEGADLDTEIEATAEVAKAEPVVEEKAAKKKEKKSFFGRSKKPKKEKPKKTEAPVEQVLESGKNIDPAEPLFVPKKRGFWGSFFLVILTALITAAIVLGGVYFYTQNTVVQNPEKAEKVETPAVAEEESTAKYVYVNSAAGLNLRKEASTVSEILSIIPNGSKLKVTSEDEGWYKVEFQGKEGYVSKEFVTEKNPYEYTNEKYGFSLTFPESWASYKVFEKTTEWGSFTATSYYVGLPTNSTDWVETTADKGYATLFAFTPFTAEQWSLVQAEEQKPTKLGESGAYVIGWDHGQAYPTDLTARSSEIAKIVATFLAKKH